MTAPLPRGACPSLLAPMQTGDGWLARLNPADGALTAGQLGAVARAAAALGNGILEITARGSLQVRGLTPRSAAELAECVGGLGIVVRPGIPVDTGPLSGLEDGGVADPRPLANEIRSRVAALGLDERLGPKVSVTVDGGGALHLGEVPADVKLEVLSANGRWRIGVAGDGPGAKILGCGSADQAAARAVALLSRIAAIGLRGRARDLTQTELAALADGLDMAPAGVPRPPAPPVGTFALKGGGHARGFCLPFGRIESENLLALTAAVPATTRIRLARGRGLLALGLPAGSDRVLVAAARRLDLVTEANDPKLNIIACAGAPACGAACLATKALAREIAGAKLARLDGSFRLHLSGCEKRCAQPSGPNVTLVGHASGCSLLASGMTVDEGLRNVLLQYGERHLLAAASRE